MWIDKSDQKKARKSDQKKRTEKMVKNNKPKYIIIEFEESAIESMSEEESIENIADKILNTNIDAFRELAK